MKLSTCIATYRRPERLRLLLDDLVRQSVKPDEVIVVDNDAAASARQTVSDFQLSAKPLPFQLIYAVQPVKNISLTRNRAIALAAGGWLSFLDDDERAPPDWLESMLDCAREYHADAVLGPVVAMVPDQAPHWAKRGRFFDLPRLPHGSVVPPNLFKMGNALIRADVLNGEPGPFDVSFGLTGGEDGDLLSRLAGKGFNIVWCDLAPVTEPVEPARIAVKWLVLRAMRGGQDFARHTFRGRYGAVSGMNKIAFLLRSVLQFFVASVVMVAVLPFGKHMAVRWLMKASANAGKLSYVAGWHYREYA